MNKSSRKPRPTSSGSKKLAERMARRDALNARRRSELRVQLKSILDGVERDVQPLKPGVDYFVMKGASGRSPMLAAYMAEYLRIISGQRAMTRARSTFDVLSIIVPPRISDEEIGDSLERISAMVAAGQAPWRVYLLIMATVFWVLVHAVHAVMRGLPQKKGG